jgi:glycosyltransferase involved in cell wall biosynthesis
MRVAFDTRVLGDPATAERGIGRYAASLLDALRESQGENEVVPLRVRRRPGVPARAAQTMEHVLLERDVRRAGADLVHAPSVDGASLRPGAPLVVTVHDLLPLKHPDRYLNMGINHGLLYAGVFAATHLIAPSEVVADDLTRLLRVPRKRLTVVREAPAPVFSPVADPRARLERLALPERFLLWVGGLDPVDERKGVAALAAAVKAGDGPSLVLAGRADEQARALAAPERVLLAGRVSDAELAALYSAADALVFPSEDEGFGLPPVEALACGTPVAAYAAGGVPEAVAGATGVELVEPGDLAGLLAAAERLSGAAAKAPPRDWADVARETWAVYEAGHAAPRPG